MKTQTLALALVLVLVLTSCSPAAPTQPTATPVDIGAVQTAAVQTIVAAVTQTASAFTATPQPTETVTPTPVPTESPTITPTPTPAGTPTETVCDNLLFISDASVPDNTQMTPGQEFVKSWHVKNTGACAWNVGYDIVFAYGDKMGGQTTALTAEVLPNTEADISIPLKAPTQPGTYSGYWRLSSNNGYPFGTTLTVVIVVVQ